MFSFIDHTARFNAISEVSVKNEIKFSDFFDHDVTNKSKVTSGWGSFFWLGLLMVFSLRARVLSGRKFPKGCQTCHDICFRGCCALTAGQC